MSVNRHYRQLMMSNDARCSLWMDHCQKFWHYDRHHQLQPPPKFIDDCCLPIAATTATDTDTDTNTDTSGSGENNNNKDTTNIANLSLLLSLTPANFPTCVDQDVLKARMRLNSRIQQTIPIHRQDEEDGQLIHFYYHLDKDNKNKTPTTTGNNNNNNYSRSLVRYTGYVGQGDRCVRSNHPLPRPSRPTCYSYNDNDNDNDTHNNASRSRSSGISNSSMSAFGAAWLGGNQHFEPHRPFLMNLLRCGSKSMMGGSGRSSKSSSSSSSSTPSSSTSSSSPEWTPFVVPFVDQSSNGNITNINVTPRFVSYYEVSILKMDDDNDDDGEEDAVFSSNTAATTTTAAARLQRRRRPSHRSSHTDCVAVGLATESFQVQSRMPGWDRQSFGYHGDDGGIFHSSGGMLKEFGPKYGPGDTVGCGIDYIAKGIFYTLNGKFLGYAWKDLGNAILQTDLFPVVGLDTNCPIHLNFGTNATGNEAFQFDLSSFIKKHETIIASTFSYSLDKCSSSCSGTSTSTTTTTTTATTNTTTTTTAGTTASTTNKSSTHASSSLSASLRRHRRSLPGRRTHRRDRK